ncbi:MAG: DNA repair protein RecN, partial [Nitrospirota bacterium]
MLRALRIKDLAIIDELNLEFIEGFAVFTGETGAGKSIIVDALDLITGGRGSSDIIRDGCEETVVEGIFDRIDKIGLHNKLSRYGIETDSDELIIRRSINRNGRNRLYINGALSTISVLNDISSRLIDIHGQHEHQTLLRKESHCEYLDAFGKLSDMKNMVARKYQIINDLQIRLNKIEENVRGKKEKEELLQFQLSEIKGASIRAGEDRELVEERNILSNSQNLSALSHEAYSILYENDESVISSLGKVEDLLTGIAGIDEKMGEAADMTRTSSVSLKEVSDIIRRFKDNIRYDPERLESVTGRIYLLDRLKKKYGMTIEDILACQERVEKDLESIGYSDQEAQAIREEMEKVLNDAGLLATELSDCRRGAALRFEKEIWDELSHLSMDNTKFVINIESVPLSQNGIDSVEFMIANMNEEPRQLARVASGGELSRIVLAIKSRLSSMDSGSTLIFDEVDAGIGGGVAEEVGIRLKSLSHDNQVFCVTHLPQIAAMADSHFYVEKVVSGDRVVTKVKKLDRQERVEEISRMLGGRDMTKTAMKYAAEMIERTA